jgi:phosphoribosylaminoimidazole-succinocarboxamide synthase
MLCQISNFWFGKTDHIVRNHLTGIDVASVLSDGVDARLYARRAVVTKRLKPVPIECIARGYLIGSGWKDYQRTGRVSGIALPDSLRQAEQLPEPIFTPSTKAAVGDHDENIDFDTAVHTVGADLAEQVRDATLRLYKFARDYAAERGIILADTKFEFGLDADGRLYVMDEMLTPTPRATGRPTSTKSAPARRATTSSSCATTWRRWTGTRRRRARSCPPK